MTVKVSKCYPIPSGTGRGVKSKVDFRNMEVGDSFLVAEVFTTLKGAAGSAYHYWPLLTDFKFSIRKTPDGYRCWRIR